MNKKINNYIEGTKPVHRLSFCAFLDVLGFSARISESYTLGTGNNLLQEFHSTFGEVTSKLKDQAKDAPLYYKSFSDNVLLAIPRYSHDMESESGNILLATSEYQFQMALKGFFVRGGISLGRLFIDDNSVYGGALVDAYELESKVAVNPIVVLCKNTEKLVKKHLTYYADEWAPQRRILLINSDGHYFINYLDECIIDSGEDLTLDADSLLLHKKQITNSLSKYAHQPAVFAKFSWLAAYHNYFCESVAAYPEYSKKLKISSKLMTVKFSQLEK
jgi:hypothetical protein